MENSTFNPPQAWKESTPEDRAAHLFACFEAWRAIQLCREEGITEAQIAAGSEKRDIELHVYQMMKCRFGSPEYGSWPDYAAQVKADMIAAETARRANREMDEAVAEARNTGLWRHPEVK